MPGVAEREKAALARAVAHNVVPRGLEPRTLRLLAVRSNQLSYETFWLPWHLETAEVEDAQKPQAQTRMSVAQLAREHSQ